MTDSAAPAASPVAATATCGINEELRMVWKLATLRFMDELRNMPAGLEVGEGRQVLMISWLVSILAPNNHKMDPSLVIIRPSASS